MVNIQGKLFGTPMVLKNQEQVMFPYRKAEALFYYLLVRKQATRENLVHLFWADVDEDVAKKNLRNAVYIIKKVFEEDVLISPQRALVMLNPDIQFETDIDVFMRESDEQGIKAYTGAFLEGILVKDAENFEDWMFGLREQLKDTYIGKLYREIQRCLKEKKLTSVEAYCKALIKEDEFDERAYRILMHVYRKMGKYEKSIENYERLSSLLNRELAVAPDLKTIELYEDIMGERAQKQESEKYQEEDFFYGRRNELNWLQDYYYRFIKEKKGKCILLSGDAGIGKSKLLERFLQCIDRQKLCVLSTQCYQAEENYLLKPWYEIFIQLSKWLEREHIEIPIFLRKSVACVFPGFVGHAEIEEVNVMEEIDYLKYQVAEKAIIEIFKMVSDRREVMLVFEDLHWIDDMSLSLLKNIMIMSQGKAMMVIGTSRKGHDDKLERFFIELSMRNMLGKLEIQAFSREESYEFACQYMQDGTFSYDVGEHLYQETEGNTFFLIEYLNILRENGDTKSFSPKMQDILKSRFLNVSQEGKKVLAIASMFFDKVSFELLKDICDKQELELLDLIDELQDKYLLKEIKDGERIEFVFSHQKLREFIYEQLSHSKRRVLHHRIAMVLELQLKNNKRDLLLYSKLIYHFERAGNKRATVKYVIKNIYEYLHMHHEIFPVLQSEDEVEKSYMHLSEEQAARDLEKISHLIAEAKLDEGDVQELIEYEIIYLHMMGRNLIRRGDYDQGLMIIEQMIEKAKALGSISYALEGYRQIIYYCINTYKTSVMAENIEKALQIAQQYRLAEEIGILLRLKGLLKVMEGKFSEGEALLKDALAIFERLGNEKRYILNIAAIYNYLGEGKRYGRAFRDAIGYYEKAIHICEERKILRGCAIFHTNAGQAALDMGDDEKAKFYLKNALAIFEELDSLWGRSTARGYLALLFMKEGKYQEALDILRKAEMDAEKLKSPYEQGLILRVKAEIRKQMDLDQDAMKIFQNYLSKSVEVYAHEGMTLLRSIGGCYELDILDGLRKEAI
ncbi:DNA-binding SARP family transcriptional activator [Anaerosolibacter carboniphilus]|uniref:DNA-binding SARP family transcriptional activator n=1 Tax=Anaerosolibacter carboniphilus TaxID=1417629 RepID=A0A841KVT5_9FIRM|nr:AAA family ATPase [Anaerosolibacter carboniphilus]MBB6217551.1 DNA-binding SARP family transcriptional activator [Anaerosolibacter carboniphilus]